MDILMQTMRNEGILALYKGSRFVPPIRIRHDSLSLTLALSHTSHISPDDT